MTEEWLHPCPFSVGSRRGVWGPSSPRPWERALSKPTRSEDWISHPCLELPSQNHEDSKDCYWERTWCNSAVPQVGQGCLCFGIFHLPYGGRMQSDSMSQLYVRGKGGRWPQCYRDSSLLFEGLAHQRLTALSSSHISELQWEKSSEHYQFLSLHTHRHTRAHTQPAIVKLKILK